MSSDPLFQPTPKTITCMPSIKDNDSHSKLGAWLTEEEMKILEGSVKGKGGHFAVAEEAQEVEEATETSTPLKRGRPLKG